MKRTLLCCIGAAALTSLVLPTVLANVASSSPEKFVEMHPAQPYTELNIPSMEGAKVFKTATPRTVAKEGEAPVFTPDWSTNFATDEEFNLFTVIDANGDANKLWDYPTNTWCHRGGEKCAVYNHWGSTADDWLVTPGFKLKAGKKYTFSYSSCIADTYMPAITSVAVGKAPTAEALTNVLIKDNETLGYDIQTDDAEFIPEEDGVYYFGIHLTKLNYMTLLAIYNVEIKGQPLAASPTAISGLQIIPDAAGAPKAELTFTLPTKTVDGNTLSSLKGVKILDGMYEIADVTADVAPGKALTYKTADFGEAGYHTFKVVPYNDVDEGIATIETAYIGLDIPNTPQNFRLVDSDNRVIARWDAYEPAHGGVFFPENVFGNIHEITRDEYGFPAVGNLVVSVKAKTEVELNMASSDGEQQLISYVMNATNEAGPSPNYWQCSPLLLGKPYSTPYLETFNSGYPSSFWAKGGNASVYSVKAGGFDPENGCIALDTRRSSNVISMLSGKISLAETTSPKYAFRLGDFAHQGTFQAYVTVPSGEGTEDILLGEAVTLENKRSYETKIYDLSPYKKYRYVRVGFIAKAEGPVAYNNNSNVYIDHVEVGDMPEADLRPVLTAPRNMKRGEATELGLRIYNYGQKPVSSFRLRLTDADRVISDNVIKQNIGALDTLTMKLPFISELLRDADSVNLTVTLEAEGDGVAENNSDNAVIRLIEPERTPASGLTGYTAETPEGLAVNLKWNKASEIAHVTDDFESYKHWTMDNIGAWKGVDVDKGACGSFTDQLYYDGQGEPFAFTVFNPYIFDTYQNAGLFDIFDPDNIQSFVPHSGDQYLAAIFSGDLVWDPEKYGYDYYLKDADNWLISPEQDGREQTVSFYVNNYMGLAANGRFIDHIEKFEVLASSTDTELTSFERIGDVREASGGEWTKVTIELPKGTKYFAIHHISQYDSYNGTPFIFMIDDITVETDNDPVAAYRLYRDGELLIQLPDTEYIDKKVAADTEYLYQVTALYDDSSESIPVSVTVKTNETGVTQIASAEAPADIYSVDGRIIRRNATSLDGLDKGVYIIRGRKVIVK